MKSIVTTVPKVAHNLTKAFQDAANDTVRIMKDPNSTMSDVDQVWKNFEQAARNAGHDSASGAQGEFEEHLTKQYQQAPHHMSAEDAKARAEQEWNQIKQLGDKIIKAAPKVVAAAKWGWLKFAAATTAIFAAMIGAFSMHDWVSPDARSQIAFLNHVQRDKQQMDEVIKIGQMIVSEEELNIFVGGLVSAPTPQETPAIAALAAPLPPPIAAAAAEPAQVVITTQAGTTQTIDTTVEHVYREAPERVQRVMVQNPPPPPIEHDYNKPTDYTVHLDDYRTQNHPHKSFTVNSGFASVSVSY